MSTAGEKSLSSDTAHLDTIFKQKKVLRSVIKRDLKSMDPILRSQQDEAIQKIVLEAPWFKACKGLCAYISCSALREVDTNRILSHILTTHSQDVQMRKKLFVPRVEDRNRNMRMLNISSTEDLIASSLDILEPAPLDSDGNEREDGYFVLISSKTAGKNLQRKPHYKLCNELKKSTMASAASATAQKYMLFANEPVDLFILPGLAFDKAGRRLGRGGGYYDTFLSRYEELAKKKNWKQPLKIALSYPVQIVDEGTIPLTPNDILVDALVSPSGVIPISPAALEICH